MPISYDIDQQRGVIFVTFSGRVTVQEFAAQRAAVLSDPRYHEALHRLTDVRDLAELPATEQLREFARVAATAQREEPPGVRRGLVVGSPVTYGVARQYQAFLSSAGFEVDILAGDAEAELWLAGLPTQAG